MQVCFVSICSLSLKEMILLTLLVVLLPLSCCDISVAINPFSKELFAGLHSLPNPRGPAIRKKVLPLLFKLMQSNVDSRMVDCLQGLLHIISNELNCNTSSTILLKHANNVELTLLYTNVTFLESILQRNCSLLTRKKEWFCHQVLTGVMPYDVGKVNLPQIMNDCFDGYKGPLSSR